MSQYHPEPYWSDVAKRIKSRKGQNVIAGDDEPYYRYKRERFLDLLNEIDFSGKTVLEIGNGPGGNLKALLAQHPKSLTGVDISPEMVALAKSHLPPEVNIVQINGTQLPFEDKSFDYVFTATVLQHNTDEVMLKKIMAELCRVAKEKVFLFERIEPSIIGDDLCYGRPVDYYASICQEHGFTLNSTKWINIRSSYYVSGAIRKGLNPKTRAEGEPLNGLSIGLQNFTLFFTRFLDRIFTSRRDVARMEFIRNTDA